ncbi:MAG: hypothetical protein ACYC1M_06455 [Armatimonadota bacterium]
MNDPGVEPSTKKPKPDYISLVWRYLVVTGIIYFVERPSFVPVVLFIDMKLFLWLAVTNEALQFVLFYRTGLHVVNDDSPLEVSRMGVIQGELEPLRRRLGLTMPPRRFHRLAVWSVPVALFLLALSCYLLLHITLRNMLFPFTYALLSSVVYIIWLRWQAKSMQESDVKPASELDE